MSPVQTRKRRRSVAFDSSESIEQAQNAVEETVVQNGDSVKALQDDPEKMADVWEAFREEYYEVLEQLPLTLHRSFALIRELDEQSQGHNVDLLQSLLKYIEYRNTVGKKPPDLLPKEESQPERSTEQRRTQAPTVVSKPQKSSQEMLSHIAWLAEEVVRASQEKVNVAQSAYDSADRQIRLLDFAIKEQETSLTLGLKTGNLLPIFGDGIVGRWVRPPRDDMGVDNFGQNFQDDGVPTLGVVTQESLERMPITNRRKRKGKGRKKSIVPPATGGSSLKLTVPPLANVALSVDDMPVDPNEPRYCHCHQVSFGEMVGCDNPNCQGGEWFHLGCVGLDKPPKGEWYCQNCQEQMKAEPARHGRSRKGR